jgi:hypothetical protein
MWVAEPGRTRRALATGRSVFAMNMVPRPAVAGASSIVGRLPWNRYGGVKISMRWSNSPAMEFFLSRYSGSEPTVSTRPSGSSRAELW